MSLDAWLHSSRPVDTLDESSLREHARKELQKSQVKSMRTSPGPSGGFLPQSPNYNADSPSGTNTNLTAGLLNSTGGSWAGSSATCGLPWTPNVLQPPTISPFLPADTSIQPSETRTAAETDEGCDGNWPNLPREINCTRNDATGATTDIQSAMDTQQQFTGLLNLMATETEAEAYVGGQGNPASVAPHYHTSQNLFQDWWTECLATGAGEMDDQNWPTWLNIMANQIYS